MSRFKKEQFLGMLNWMEISRIRFRWQRIWNFKDTNTCHRQGYEKNTWDILRRWVTWRWLFLPPCRDNHWWSPRFPAPSLQEITSTTLIWGEQVDDNKKELNEIVQNAEELPLSFLLTVRFFILKFDSGQLFNASSTMCWSQSSTAFWNT